MRVAVTGAGGRLGRALIGALAEAPFTGLAGPLAWSRTDIDLDAPEGVTRLIERDRPEVVIHAAAWTDVDGCARDPELALRRNGVATGVLAAACVTAGVDLVFVSTNEVFDGRRTDGRGYRPDDAVAPANPYGASKLAGESAARAAFAAWPGGPSLAIVRTAWLYGPPGGDFPDKIIAAALRAREAGEPLRVVGDEMGSPTSTADLAEAIVELVGSGEIQGIVHYADVGAVSRAAWAREVVRLAGLVVPIVEVPASTWVRASTPPRWGVLESSRLPSGGPMRPWTEALADHVPWLRRSAASMAAALSAGGDR
jgi:dTDP-4-dehydrorhamnose reductase